MLTTIIIKILLGILSIAGAICSFVLSRDFKNTKATPEYDKSSIYNQIIIIFIMLISCIVLASISLLSILFIFSNITIVFPW